MQGISHDIWAGNLCLLSKKSLKCGKQVFELRGVHSNVDLNIPLIGPNNIKVYLYCVIWVGGGLEL